MPDLVVPVEKNIAELSYDPTQSKTLRNDFRSEFYPRWDSIRGAVRTSIVQNDALRLNTASLQTEPVDKFGNTAQSRSKAFEEWLRQNAQREFQMDQTQRQNTSGNQPQPAGGVPPWIYAFALAAYVKGLQFANRQLKKIGQTPFIPPDDNFERVIKDRSALSEPFERLANRIVEEIAGLIDRVVNKSRQRVADGIESGDSRYSVVSAVNDVISKVGITDGRRIASTETMRMINNASLTAYQQVGVEEVSVKWTTRGDNRVCEDCMEKSGTVYSVEDAFGVLPHHVSGRCYFLPA